MGRGTTSSITHFPSAMTASSLHAQALLLLLSTYHSYCINPLLICACIQCSLLAWPEAVLAPVPCLNTIYPSKLLTPHPLPHSHPFTDLYEPKRTTHAGRRRHHDDAPLATDCFSTPALVPCLAARTPCFPSLALRSSGLGSASRPLPLERDTGESGEQQDPHKTAH